MALVMGRRGESCSVCAVSRTPRHLPTGKLMPLTITQRPWFHIAVDFVMDLPLSKGYTVVLAVLGRFSKLFFFFKNWGLLSV